MSLEAVLSDASRMTNAPAVAMPLVESLLDQLPRAPYAIKDTSLRYFSINAAMLDLCGAKTRLELIGRTARDFFHEAVWQRHEALERQVMRTRAPMKDRLDHCRRLRGAPLWLLLSRWPVTDDRNAVVGVATIARLLDAPDRRHPTYARLADVVEHIHANYGGDIGIESLAIRARTSVSQLERDFLTLFGLTPRRYLAKVRIEAAFELLSAGGPIVEVAHACGYSDQSAFTRRFRAATGMSPSEYRRASIVRV